MKAVRHARPWRVVALALIVHGASVQAAQARMDEHSRPGAARAAPADTPSPPAGAETLQADEDRVGRLVLEARVNGEGPFHFIVDTGANHTAVSPALVERLGLTADSRAVRLNGVTGADATSERVTLSSIVAGRFARAEVAAVVIQPRVLAGADGLLGANLLMDSRVTFDFVRRRVTIAPSSDATRTADHRIVSQARFAHGGLLAVKSWIAGVKTTAIIDTGAQNTLGNRTLEAEIPPDRFERWRQTTVTVLGVTAHTASARAVVTPRVRLGRSVVRNAIVMFGDFHVFELWELDDTPAMLVGMDVLSATKTLVIDYGRQQVIMDPRATATTVRVRNF